MKGSEFVDIYTDSDRAADTADRIAEKISGGRILFVCVLGNTETGKIPGISAAGADPSITDYTPAADAEFLYYGRCKSLDGVPVTPTGIPTPGIITRAVLNLSGFPVLITVGGVNIRPRVPYTDLGGCAGGNIAEGRGVENSREIFAEAELLGRNLGKVTDVLVIGESIAGGTTTAYGVLTALGYGEKCRVSSSLPENPVELKEATVRAGFEKTGFRPGDLKKEPFVALKHFGDPMQPAAAGLAAGAASSGASVVLAGGTQMAAVIALMKSMGVLSSDDTILGTTRWILEDVQSDIKGLMADICSDIPIMAARLDFSDMPYDGLRVYEKGVVKEGVGAGGISAVYLLRTGDMEGLKREIAAIYREITGAYPDR